ncbi:MAG: hypothetical protein DCF26_08355 [Burkholderiales bacterium]|nr:MAG: hypothetical protein DCF26_08355 [Burkholderiales bacterium]
MTAHHLCERVIDSADYLERQGMTVQQLRSMHHPMTRLETYSATYRYFGIIKDLKRLNADYAHRLIFVAGQHRLGLGGLSTLIEKALVRWPIAPST